MRGGRRPTCAAQSPGRPGLATVLAAFLSLVHLACGWADSDEDAAASRIPTDRPNLVLVVGDDHGYPDFGFMGSPWVRTPHLDSLAAGGTVFESGYTTASICGPSLRSLLTGVHPLQRVARLKELGAGGDAGGRTEALTLPELLRARGYVSMEAGKLVHESYRAAGFTHGTKDGQPGFGPGRRLGRESLDPLFAFLEENRTRPFFVWFAPMLPHTPHDAPSRYFEGLSPDLVRAAGAYYANVARFDAVVGKLVAKLDALGVRERTLIVYLADNGWDQLPHVPRPPGMLDGPRGKRSMYDLGFRTPIVFNWPGVVPAGQRRSELVSAVDLLPTLLDYAGAGPAPADRLGHDLRPVIEGRGEWPRERVFMWMQSVRDDGRRPAELGPKRSDGWEPAASVREGRWHYIHYRAYRCEELFDVVADPREETNLAAQKPDIARRLRGGIHAWERGLGAIHATRAHPPAIAEEEADPPRPGCG